MEAGYNMDETASMTNLGEFPVGIFEQVWITLTCDLVNILTLKNTAPFC